ncbi:MAG: hypothetical protein OXK73_17540 [Rhodospirillaceae bacterium]|nr:hypothetical protein [Rhodospirillaceae bacterium]
MTVRGAVIAAALLAAAIATAQDPPLESATGDTAIVSLLREDGATVDFIGATPGLAGYRVTRPDDDVGYTLYVTPSGHAVVGTLYAPDGLLVTAQQLAAAEAGRAPPSQAADSALETDPQDVDAPGPPPSHGFTLGSAGRRVQIFADPACPFSRSTVARFAHAALQGELTLEVIPVALLGADSARQALAAVGEDGLAAWFDRRGMQPTPATAAALRENNAAHAATGLGVVPILRTFSGGAWHAQAGAVDNVAAFLEAAP